MKINLVGTAGGVGVSTLAVSLAQVLNGTVVARGAGFDLAGIIGDLPSPSEVYRFKFGGEKVFVADCGRMLPPDTDDWHTVLVVPRRYLGVRQATRAGDCLGYVDVVTEHDVLNLRDVRNTLNGITHLGTLTHCKATAHALDAGLLNVRLPRQLHDDTVEIADNINQEVNR